MTHALQTETPPIRTSEEIRDLQRQGLLDEGDGWVLEDTDGFEAHHDELKAFADKVRAKEAEAAEERRRQEFARIQRKANDLGCTVALALLIDGFEQDVARLRSDVGPGDGVDTFSYRLKRLEGEVL